MKKVLFICHGNICRSPMAEFVFKSLVENKGLSHLFLIESCATSNEETGNSIHYGTQQQLKKENIPFNNRKARKLTKADYNNFDYLITMDSNNVRNALKIIGDDNKNKVSKLLDFTSSSRDIADPWYTGDFQVTYDDILNGCNKLLEHIIKED